MQRRAPQSLRRRARRIPTKVHFLPISPPCKSSRVETVNCGDLGPLVVGQPFGGAQLWRRPGHQSRRRPRAPRPGRRAPGQTSQLAGPSSAQAFTSSNSPGEELDGSVITFCNQARFTWQGRQRQFLARGGASRLARALGSRRPGEARPSLVAPPELIIRSAWKL